MNGGIKMHDICCVEQEKKKLLGAVIGLARATEGNVNRPTQSTHNAILQGIRMLAPNIDYTHCEIQKHIETLHNEKFKLVSRCLSCEKQCGRNNDYDLTMLDNKQNELSSLKYSLLSNMMITESLLRNQANNQHLFEKAMELLYKTFFFLGCHCNISGLTHLICETGELNQELFLRYFNTSQTEIK